MDYSLPLSYKSQILNCSQPRLSSSIGRYPCRLINRDKHRTPVVVCYGSSPVRPSRFMCLSSMWLRRVNFCSHWLNLSLGLLVSSPKQRGQSPAATNVYQNLKMLHQGWRFTKWKWQCVYPSFLHCMRTQHKGNRIVQRHGSVFLDSTSFAKHNYERWK